MDTSPRSHFSGRESLAIAGLRRTGLIRFWCKLPIPGPVGGRRSGRPCRGPPGRTPNQRQSNRWRAGVDADERSRLIARYKEGHRVVKDALKGATDEELD